MSDTVIRVENLSKLYRLGLIGSSTLHDDLNRWLARVRRKPDPPKKISDFGFEISDLDARKNGHGAQSGGENQQSAISNQQSDSIWALRDVSFEVKRGEVVGIIGRNGAGKSTLLKILSRITAPTSGQVKVKGRIASLLEVGTGFHPELTGRENIFLNGAILGMRKAEIAKKFDEIVAFAEVEKFIDTPVKRYSSGMYVRLAFAVAAHLEPEILLVDEVLAVGDAAFQKKCLGKMGDVAKEGRTVLFVSHNMGAISSLCKFGILLVQGKVEASGVGADVIALYLNGNRKLHYSESLINHPNRNKGMRQLLSSFGMDIQNGVAYYGKSLTLFIGYDFPEKIAIPQFCVSFVNTNGITVFTLVSDYQSNDIPHVLCGKGQVKCKIECLPLLPGSYLVNLRLWQPGEKLDDIENVMMFKVEWLNRELGQFNWDAGMGLVYVDATWSLSNPLTT